MASRRTAKRRRKQLPPDVYAERASEDARRVEKILKRLMKASKDGNLTRNELLLLLEETQSTMEPMAVHYWN
jgi:hypothetical protein